MAVGMEDIARTTVVGVDNIPVPSTMMIVIGEPMGELIVVAPHLHPPTVCVTVMALTGTLTDEVKSLLKMRVGETEGCRNDSEHAMDDDKNIMVAGAMQVTDEDGTGTVVNALEDETVPIGRKRTRMRTGWALVNAL